MGLPANGCQISFYIPEVDRSMEAVLEKILAGCMQIIEKGYSMDYDSYRKAYFVKPAPQPRFPFAGSFGVTLYYESYSAAVAFYEQVLGPPAYVEGQGTRGWPIGDGWLTLLQGRQGNPKNVEVTFELAAAEDAEALQTAFIAAGTQGPTPSDQLMYRPIRSCPVTDPFGVDLMIIAAL